MAIEGILPQKKIEQLPTLVPPDLLGVAAYSPVGTDLTKLFWDRYQIAEEKFANRNRERSTPSGIQDELLHLTTTRNGYDRVKSARPGGAYVRIWKHF